MRYKLESNLDKESRMQVDIPTEALEDFKNICKQNNITLKKGVRLAMSHFSSHIKLWGLSEQKTEKKPKTILRKKIPTRSDSSQTEHYNEI